MRKHIPNAITSCNLLSGVVGLVFAFRGRYDIAFMLMMAAGVFDFFDGLAARALRVQSPIGKELDSLADVVSFGVLPAVMLSGVTLSAKAPASPSLTFIIRLIPLLMAVFCALRLAKFNLDERQHASFLGLPCPAAAMVSASAAAYCFYRPESAFAELCGGFWLFPLLAIALSALMLSEIPFFAFKFGNGSKGEQKAPSNSAAESLTAMKRTAVLCLGALAIISTAVLGWNWTAAILGTFAAYIIENLIFSAFRI